METPLFKESPTGSERHTWSRGRGREAVNILPPPPTPRQGRGGAGMERAGRLRRAVSAPVGGAESGAPRSPRPGRATEEGVLGGPQLGASHQSPATRPAALQGGFPLSEPRMTARTIYLAIRVVKNTLSDTRSKVTGPWPRGEGTPGPLPGKQREASRWPPIGVAFAPLQLCGRRPASSRMASCWKSWLPATTEQGWQRARPRDAVPTLSEGLRVES